MSKGKEILKDAGIYTLSSYIAQFLDFITGILIRNFLGPVNMGIWAFLQVIQNYAKHSGLGVTTATARDIPYYLGKGEAQKAREIQNLVFSFSVTTTVLTAALIAIWAIVNRNHYSQPITVGLFVVAGLTLLQRLYNLFVVVIRSYKQFTLAGWLNIVSSAVTLFFSVTLAWRFGLYGYYAAALLTFTVLLGIIWTRTPHRFHWDFRWEPMKPLLNLGFAIVISDALRSILMSIDRIMIARFLGFEALGHYTIALMAGNYLYSLPNMINIIFFPHLQEILAKRDSLGDLERYVRGSALCVAFLFPYIIGLVWTSSEWLIPVLLPQYTSGIPALKFFIIGSFFMALTHPFTSFLITAKKHWVLIPTQALAIAAGFAMSWAVIQRGGGIEGIAAASTGTFFILFLVLVTLAGRDIPGLHPFKLFIKMMLPILTAAGILIFLERISVGPASLTFLVQYSVFAVLMIPFVILAEREAQLISKAASVIKEMLLKRKAAALKPDPEDMTSPSAQL
jgi:O-antigen/teichoic acid export membrane protein